MFSRTDTSSNISAQTADYEAMFQSRPVMGL